MNALPMLEALTRLESHLAGSKKRKFHAMPSWWRAEVTRFYESGRRQSVWRVGRRGGKSSTICRLVCLEAYYGNHEWPDDDEGVVMIISADQKQAKARLRTCAVLLDEMRIKIDQTADELRFNNYRGQRVVIRVHSASISSVVGATCICAVLDEVARWGENDRTGNPSEAILESLIPTMATQPNAKIFMISSPMGEDDLHAKAFTEGETEFQTVHFAPTWEANPTLTIEMCRVLAKTDRIFKREYAAIPQGAFEHGFYDYESLVRCSDKDREPAPMKPTAIGHQYFVAADPGFTHDAFGVAIAHAEHDGAGGVQLVLDYVREIRGDNGYLPPKVAVQIVVGLRQQWPGGFGVVGDQASGAVLQEMFLAQGVMYDVQPWTATNLVEKHSTVATLARDGRLKLPKLGLVQTQLAKLGVKITAGGLETIQSADGHIGDAASAAVAALSEAHKHAPMTIAGGASPFPTYGRRIEGVTAPQVNSEGDEKFTESSHCAICGSERGKCPHTA